MYAGHSCTRHSFPEILSVQISRLVNRMREESTKKVESGTRRQLRDKIAALSQSQLARATDVLAMIWSGVAEPLDPPTPGLGLTKPTVHPKLDRTLFPKSSNWERLRLALLKSISTGVFIDVQFYAYNAIGNDTPFDPRSLFTSSIVIQEWAPAIATRKLKHLSINSALM